MARRPVPGESHDPSRREFFRTFTRQTVHNAGAVVGAANELQRTSLAAARELLDEPGAMQPMQPARAGADTGAVATANSTFRSAYRFTSDAIVLLDQRELPHRVVTLDVREPTEIASAMRTGAVTGGPVLGELAAYGVVLAARRAAERNAASREQLVRAALGTLRAARREVRALTAAVDRIESRYDELAAAGASATETSDELAAEADAISSEAATAHARIGRLAANALDQTAAGTGQINVLAHGDAGPLSCGLVGMATTCFRSLLDAGVGLHVWLTSAAPTEEGSRVSAYQLAQSDVPHTVIPDTAVDWLLTSHEIHAVMLRGDAVSRSGDVVALIGARAVARLAADARVPVVVLAPRVAVDPGLADLTSLVQPSAVPAAEIVNQSLISTVVTEEAP